MNYDFINKIAELITEDPDIFTKYNQIFKNNTVLGEEVYAKVIGLLNNIARKNNLILDKSKLKLRFNPAGFTVKNVSLIVNNRDDKEKLADKLVKSTGDVNLKHTFNKNLKLNLYNAISNEFSEAVRSALNLEITHQVINPDSNSKNDVLPMFTIIQPSIKAGKPEVEVSDYETEQPQTQQPELGGDVKIGKYGLESVDDTNSEVEAAPEPKPGEEVLSFEHINKIASIIIEDL